MTRTRILVAGIGNVFLGDDGFGVAVVERLARRTLREGVVVMDVGIRGLDLTYALMTGYDAAIWVDTTSRGGRPGTLYVIAPELGEPDGIPGAPTFLDAHGMDPVQVLGFLRASGSELRLLRVVGCEPETFGSDEDPRMGLSAAISAAIDPAVDLIEAMIEELSSDQLPDRRDESRAHHHA